MTWLLSALAFFIFAAVYCRTGSPRHDWFWTFRGEALLRGYGQPPGYVEDHPIDDAFHLPSSNP